MDLPLQGTDGVQHVAEVGAVAEILLGELGLNNAVCIDDENARMRNAVGEVTGFIVLIEDTKGIHDRDVFIMKHVKRDPPLLFNVLQRLDRIISDRGHSHTGFNKLGINFIQLHELINAEGSPLKGSVENQNEPFFAFQIRKRTDIAILILCGKFWER